MPIGTNTSGHLFDTTLTTNGPLYSATSGVLTSGAAGTAGQVYQSAGAGSPPAYSTATFPATAGSSGKILISDGTNIISSTPTYPNAASTALKHIKSDGTNFVTTTVTYPDASVSAGKVIISDGTNYIASTPTFPNAAGTTGNVLTSDGTNFVSSAAASTGPLIATATLTSAQIKALHATPIQVIAAPGAGKVISVIQVTWSFNYGGTNVFIAAAAQSIRIYWGITHQISSVISNGVLVGTASTVDANAGAGSLAFPAATDDNAAINLYNPVATEITGNAANNNTVNVNVVYVVFTR